MLFSNEDLSVLVLPNANHGRWQALLQVGAYQGGNRKLVII